MKCGSPSKEVGEGVSSKGSVEYIAAELFAIEERNLVDILDVLDVSAGFERVPAGEPGRDIGPLHDTRQDVERFHAAGRYERPVARTRCAEIRLSPGAPGNPIDPAAATRSAPCGRRSCNCRFRRYSTIRRALR